MTGGIERALKALIRHLVLSFPNTAILSRQVGDRYHVFVIVPYEAGPEKTLQVEQAWLVESARSIKETERLLQALDLPRLFQTCERYELRYSSSPQLMRVSQNPANEGWSAEPFSGTVCHGPFPLSGPSAPTPPSAVSRPYPKRGRRRHRHSLERLAEGVPDQYPDVVVRGHEGRIDYPLA